MSTSRCRKAYFRHWRGKIEESTRNLERHLTWVQRSENLQFQTQLLLLGILLLRLSFIRRYSVSIKQLTIDIFPLLL